MDFVLQEQENYTLEEVQAIVNELQNKCEEVILDKDILIEDLSEQLNEFGDLRGQNHELHVAMLMREHSIGEEFRDLIFDEDIEEVQRKIDLLSSINIPKLGEEIEEILEDDEVEEEIEEEIEEEVEDEVEEDRYIPTKSRKEDQYNKAINNKDVKSALKTKLNRAY